MKTKRIIIRIILLMLIAGSCIGLLLVLMDRNKSLYVEDIRKGYVAERSIDQIDFFYPETEASIYLKKRIPSKFEFDKTIGIMNENEFALINPSASVLYVYKTELEKDSTDSGELFKALEKGTGIRIESYHLDGNEKKDGISKSMLSVNAQGLFSQEVFNDFTGKLAMVKKEKIVCYLFVGKTSGAEISEENMEYMARSLRFLEYQTAVNPEELENWKKTDFEISEKGEIAVGENGYAYVLNKTDHPGMIKIMASVHQVTQDDEDAIRELLKGTIYKTLPKAEGDNVWQLAEIRYSFLGHSVKEVKPYLDIKAVSGNKTHRAYVLSDTEEEDADGIYHMVICYEAPEKCRLEIGSPKTQGGKPLSVLVSGRDSSVWQGVSLALKEEPVVDEKEPEAVAEAPAP